MLPAHSRLLGGKDTYQQHGSYSAAFLQEAVLCTRSRFSEAIKVTDGEFLGGVSLLISQAQELWALQAGSRFFSRWRHHHSNPDTIKPQPPSAGHGCAVAPSVPHWGQREFCSGQGSQKGWGASRNLLLQLARLIPPGTAPKIAWPKIEQWESLPEIELQKTRLLTMSQWNTYPQAPSVPDSLDRKVTQAGHICGYMPVMLQSFHSTALCKNYKLKCK